MKLLKNILILISVPVVVLFTMFRYPKYYLKYIAEHADYTTALLWVFSPLALTIIIIIVWS